MVISPDSTTLVCVPDTRESNIETWDLTTGLRFAFLSWRDIPVLRSSLTFSPDGTVVAFADPQGMVSLWHTTTRRVEVFSGHGSFPRALAISPDGRLLASGCDDQTIKIWDPTIRSSLSTGSITSRGSRAWLLSPTGLWVASMTYDNVIRIWSSATSEHAVDLREHRPKGASELDFILEFSSCGRWLSFLLPHSLKIWDTTTWKSQDQVESHFVSKFSLSSNNLALVLVESETIEIWDLHTHKLKSTFSSSLCEGSNHMSFSPNGMWLALASLERLEIWDWAAKECMQVVNEAIDKTPWHPAHGGLFHTSNGSYCVQGFMGECWTDKAQIQKEEDKAQVQMTKDSEWVTVQEKRVLWIPSQYRPRFKYNYEWDELDEKAVDWNKSGIAMLDRCGRVIYVEFDVPEIALKF